MSLRLKFAVAMVALAAAATIAGGAVSYVATEHELRQQIDASLVDAAQRVANGFPIDQRPGPDLGGGDGDEDDRFRGFTQILVQAIAADGNVPAAPNSGGLPATADAPAGAAQRAEHAVTVTDDDLAVAAGDVRRGNLRHDVEIDGELYRVLTVEVREGGAVQFARSLRETEHVLESIRNKTLLIVVGVSVLAALVGILIAQQVTRRLVRLTDVATKVAASGDLEHDVPVEGNDETGRLGTAFNGMLASLARSKKAQQQLVQDAGHELRTPLTSLRTNVRVMQRYDELSPESRQRLLADVESET